MLFSERVSFALMGPRRQSLHRVVRRIYYALPNTPLTRWWWRQYRKTWPSAPGLVPGARVSVGFRVLESHYKNGVMHVDRVEVVRPK